MSFITLLVLNSNAQFGKKKEDKKEESAVQEEGKDGKAKAELKPFKSTGVSTVDNLGNSSYNLAKATDSLQKEAAFLTVKDTIVKDPKLGDVSEIKCYSSTGAEIPCQKLDKKESLRKFEAILVSLGTVAQQIPNFVALIPGATSEVSSMATNPMKAAAAGKATTSLKEVGKLLETTGINVAALTTNIKASIKALNMIKSQ